ncbi:hypothetical protein ACJX0J_005560 [Zea mays]
MTHYFLENLIYSCVYIVNYITIDVLGPSGHVPIKTCVSICTLALNFHGGYVVVARQDGDNNNMYSEFISWIFTGIEISLLLNISVLFVDLFSFWITCFQLDTLIFDGYKIVCKKDNKILLYIPWWLQKGYGEVDQHYFEISPI